jgi:hypothetical protein
LADTPSHDVVEKVENSGVSSVMDDGPQKLDDALTST